MSSTLYYEDLEGRSLWVDGHSSFNKKGLYDLILQDQNIENVSITNSDNEIEKFSKLTGIKFKEKHSPNYSELDDNFLIPEKYKKIPLEKYFLNKLKNLSTYNEMNKQDKEDSVTRIIRELELYREKGMEDVLRCSIFIIDEFKRNNIVWGPGRGSACCSYLLYLVELHDIDSIKFSLDIDEFLR